MLYIAPRENEFQSRRVQDDRLPLHRDTVAMKLPEA
jgi:hypothetical protein